MEEKKSISSIKFFFLFLFFFLAGIILYARFISTKGLVVREYPVYNAKINANYEGFKIVHFSDILYGRTVNKKDVTNLIKKINESRILWVIVLIKIYIIIECCFRGDLY